MGIIYKQTADLSDVFGVTLDPISGQLSGRLDYRGRNRAATTPAGTVAVGAGAGAGGGTPTASLVAGSTDDIGTISIHCGTTPVAGVTATLTFHDAFVTAPFVQLQARDSAGATGIYYATTTTTTLTISTVNALGTGATVLVDYDCTGGQ